MKQLLILSGKGGTGKTTIASAFIKLLEARAYADCDVDAPNLHLITGETSKPKKTDYYGLAKAHINKELCISCDKCKEHCKFDAVSDKDGYSIKPFTCEGCAVCEFVCPTDAITLEPKIDGELMLYKDDKKVFSTAKLKMGSGTSGLLVTDVKDQMKLEATNADVAIIDGSPGIGCPVIASLSGVDTVLIVSEPSISGINDMERIIETANGFGTEIAVCINKHDTNIKKTEKIKQYCDEQNLKFVGKIPFDPKAIAAVNAGKTITDVDCPSGTAVRKIYGEIMEDIL